MAVDLSSFNTILERLESVADRLERGAAGSPGGAPAADGPGDAAITIAFDAFIKDKASPIEAAAATLAAPDVVEATQFFMDCLSQLRSIFAATATCCKPKDDQWMKFFGPYTELNTKAGKACDNRSDFFHNRKAATEALGIMMLVTVPGASGHVQNVLESMDFHAIKVMQKKNPPETAWINALKTCLKDLVEFCKENAKMGLDWKVGGEDPVAYFAASPLGTVSSASGAKAAGKGKGKGGPPPPKGGCAKPPPSEAAKAPAPSAGGGGGMSAVFSAIGQFKDGTGGLKKVSDDMKCKNLKDLAPKEATKPKAAAAAPKAAAGRNAKGPKGDPVKEYQEQHSTWLVQNYEENCTLDEVDKSQCVRITDCRNCTVRLGDRVKAIAVDNCIKVNIIVKDVISAVELVNSDRIQLQADGKVNMISVDKCDGVGIHLNKASLAAEIISSKSSEMNVTIPDDKGDEYDTIEIPIPEQFVTTIVGRKCKTEVSSLYSS